MEQNHDDFRNEVRQLQRFNDYYIIFIDEHLRFRNDSQLFLDCLQRSTNENIFCFDDIHSMTHWIDQMNIMTKIFLIISDSLEEKHQNEIAKMNNIEYIYIIHSDHVEYRKCFSNIRRIFNEKTDLLTQMSHDVKQLTTQWTFDKQNSFLKASAYDIRWYQLFIKVLLYLPCSENDWNEMFNECQLYYKDNVVTLQKIDVFRREYTREQVIDYYTQDNFIYRILNSALRTHHMNTIYKFYPLIQDLSKQLDQHYRTYVLNLKRRKTTPSIRIVYRGQYLTPTELEQLRNVCRSRQGSVLLSMFGSTTLDPRIAMSFIQSDHPENISCFFQIIIPDYYYRNQGSAFSYHSQMFLNISNFSSMPHEQEVLFSVMSRFRVKYVGRPTKNRSWIPITLEFYQDYLGFDSRWHQIKDMVCHESDEMKKELFELVEKYANKPTNWDVWWKRLTGELGARRQDGEPFVVTLYECFGDPESLMKAIELRKRHLENHSKWKDFSDPIFLIDEMKYGKPTRIITLYELFLRKMNFSELDTDDVIQSLKHAGDAYAECGCFHQNALECYEKALQLVENHSDHKTISALQNRIKRLSSHQQSDCSKTLTKEKANNSSFDEIPVKTSNYETEHLQWSTFWKFRQAIRPIRDTNRCLNIRLQYLHMFLKEKEEWLDNTYLRIFFNLPFQNSQRSFEPVEYLYQSFYFSVWTYLYKSMLCFKDHSFNQYLYETFINEWVTFNDLKQKLGVYCIDQRGTLSPLFVIIERILKKLTLMITMCTLMVTIPSGTGRHQIMIDMDQIRFQTDICIHPTKLVFFDLDNEIKENTVEVESIQKK
ncbi:unnamed protein product [Adineta ricciae]|uniref:Uncharacterized protein n=1 Tax=Adineta ricciae TaxID=249248 RepID=A0A814Z845_ADIRI|nr:unnamed protein product [Adineta ricciae]CAF1238248.1 unnamed protein product [Adineta ricciae]